MKKKVFLAFFLTLFVGIIAAPMSFAYTVSTLSNSYGPYQTGNGGEFTLVAGSDLQWVLDYYVNTASIKTKNVSNIQNSFQSFCLEKNENIYKNETMKAGISPAAVNGGTGGATNGKDPISIGTAWLYYKFATGSLSDYNYGSGRTTSAALLQNAIWYLEDEKDVSVSGNIFIADVITKFGSLANAKNDNNGAYGVQVLNLTYNGQLRQDQLVMTPIPAAIWLLGAGLLGLVGIRRRMQN